jgi:hypothetical protein
VEPVVFVLGLLLALSVLGNLRSWFGRGAGRIRIGKNWFQFNRAETQAIFAQIRDADHALLQDALRRGGTATAEAILAEAAMRYLQDQDRSKNERR